MVLLNPSARRVPVLLGLIAFLFLCTIWLSHRSYNDPSIPFTPLEYPDISGRPPAPETAAPAPPAGEEKPVSIASPETPVHPTDCRHAPGADDIYIVFKVGIVETYQKLPPHLLTLLKCVPDYGIYSDIEQNVGGQLVMDTLHDLNSTIQATYKEFQYYRQVQTLFADGQDVTAFQGNDKGDHRLGWILDKWKWLEAHRKAYLAFPDKKWYFLMEGDTFLHWNNLLQWTRGLDPDHDIYAGSQNSQAGVTFAHGGSGVLVSRAAMRKLMAGYDAMLPKWHQDIADSCCGDVAMARHFQDVGVAMTPSFPITQGETPLTMDWNERHMCAPSVSWHHVLPGEIERLWDLQTEWTRLHVSFRAPLWMTGCGSVWLSRSFRRVGMNRCCFATSFPNTLGNSFANDAIPGTISRRIDTTRPRLELRIKRNGSSIARWNGCR